MLPLGSTPPHPSCLYVERTRYRLPSLDKTLHVKTPDDVRSCGARNRLTHQIREIRTVRDLSIGSWRNLDVVYYFKYSAYRLVRAQSVSNYMTRHAHLIAIFSCGLRQMDDDHLSGNSLIAASCAASLGNISLQQAHSPTIN